VALFPANPPLKNLWEVFSVKIAQPSSSSIADFCSRYNMSRATFYRRLKRGLAPPYHKIGRSSVILLEDELAWLDRLRRGELGGKTCRKSKYT
jgi:predicted DNA-binding transcriptional regulator AlpA